MNETLTRLLIFSAGCLTGAGIAFTTLKNRFEERLNREIEAEKLYYQKKLKEAKEQQKNYISHTETVTETINSKSATADDESVIYPITPEEFGEKGYEEKQLYFYAADETLVDADDNEVFADASNVGDAIDIFIYTDAKNCYVRNTGTKTDYEIVKLDGSFASYESEGFYE